MDRDIYWLARHEGWHAAVARGVASGDAQCIKVAAKLFGLYLPVDAVVVPMPSHEGCAEQMLRVANCMEFRDTWDILKAKPHEPSHSQKMNGLSPAPIEMWMDENMKRKWRFFYSTNIYIIDNTVVTGATASSALEAFRKEGWTNVKVVSITKK